MGDSETKERVSRKRKIKYRDKAKESGDRKGAFALRTTNPKKTEYKRERIKLKDIEEDE